MQLRQFYVTWRFKRVSLLSQFHCGLGQNLEPFASFHQQITKSRLTELLFQFRTRRHIVTAGNMFNQFGRFLCFLLCWRITCFFTVGLILLPGLTLLLRNPSDAVKIQHCHPPENKAIKPFEHADFFTQQYVAWELVRSLKDLFTVYRQRPY